MTDWQGLYDALAHGNAPHRQWLAGLIQGWASREEGTPVEIDYQHNNITIRISEGPANDA